MSTAELQSELEQNLALRKEVTQKIRIVLRLIDMLESGKYVPSNFYYVPFTGPSIFEGGAVVHPDIKILNRDLAYLIQLLKDIPKNMEELKFEKYKEWTEGEIERYHQEAKRDLNRLAKKQLTSDARQESEETFNKLIGQSNSIIRHLCNILNREPTKKNMQRVLKEVGFNFAYGGNNSLGLETVQKTAMRRLRWANNNYHPETNQNDFTKLAKAWEDALVIGGEHPLITDVSERLMRIASSKKNEKKKVNI